MLDYRMKTFLTLCKEMNYRKTAERLNITQPAVTQHIQYLEEVYSCKFFIYNKKSLKMTKKAHMLKHLAENIFYQEQVLKDKFMEKGIYYLKVGATKTIGEFVISTQIKKFLKDPSHQILVEVDNTENLLKKLEKGELDFALIEGHFNRQDFKCRLYDKEKFVGICSKEHSFADRILEEEEIWKEDIFLREKGSGTRDILELYLESKNYSIVDFQKITTIGNFGLLADLIKEARGITFAYESILKKNPDLRSFQVRGWDIYGEFNYVFLDNQESQARVEMFDNYR